MKQRIIIALAFIMLSFTTVVKANGGIIKGTIKDAKTGEELIGTTVVIQGTTTGAITNITGEYELPPLAPGTYTIQVSYISYETKTIENVEVKDDEATVIDINLGESALDLEEVQVTAKAVRSNENLLLMEQKQANISKETIGAQQMSLQGISDAGSAATKMTGISKQEGSQTFNVRGLGDRYNSTTLNGLPLPSNHAEFKNIDLGLFSSDVIEYVGVEKVFTADLNADVSGANIDIVSKKQTGEPFLNLKLGSGINSAVLSPNTFWLQDGPNKSGFSNFDLPSTLDSYDFENSLNPKATSVTPNMNIGINGGTTFKFDNSSLHAFATASYDSKMGYSEIEQNRVNGSDFYRQDLDGDLYSFDTQTTGMLNLNYSRKKTELYFNSIFMNSSSQEFRELEGYVIDVSPTADDTSLVRRSEYTRNIVMVNQLLGEHDLGNGLKLKWAGAYNSVKNILPDRRHNTFVNETSNGYWEPSDVDDSDNHRYYHELNEDGIAANVSIDKEFGEGFGDKNYRTKLSLGYSLSYKKRDFEAYQFNHKLNKDQINPIDPSNPDAYFNNDNLEAGWFEVNTFYGDYITPQTYGGENTTNSFYLQGEHDVNEKLLVVLGLRYESITQSVDYKTVIFRGDQSFTEDNIFPSLSLKYALSDKSNLRLAGSGNYTVPQFKETAPFLFEGITDATMGNPYLYPSKIYNGELKYELFPDRGEIFSVAAFGKYIIDPINKFVMASATNDFTYANTGDWAYAAGIELDMKKHLLKISTETGYNQLNVGANFTYMVTNQELNGQKIIDETDGRINASFNTDHEELQGAAPILANASISYVKAWNEGKNKLSANAIYSYTSDRLNLIGYANIGNQYDKAYSSLDFVLRSDFDRFGVSLSVKNITNPDIERYQENLNGNRHTTLKYKRGVDISIGLSYKF